MNTRDSLRFSLQAVRAHRLRSMLTATGIAVGIAAVVLLTSLGEGLHRFVLSEFTQFGTNLVAVTPGRTTTLGLSGALINTVRPLDLEDAEALERVPRATAVVPMVTGNAAVEFGKRSRRTAVYGVGPDMPEVWQFELGIGRFLPRENQQSPRPLAVLGSALKEELFGPSNPLGAIVRIGGYRYRVIGVMRAKGQFLGIDLDDAVYIPTARCLELFDRESLMELDLMFAPGTPVEEAVEGIRRILIARHGREDFTITPQQQMIDVLGSVLSVLTFAIGALGGISLLVGGIGILTIMTIAIRERTPEIGLLCALGASRRQIRRFFVIEAATLSALGGLLGLALGLGGAALLALAVPALPVRPSPFHVLLAEGVAIATGLLAGVAPAQRASRLDPVEALRAE